MSHSASPAFILPERCHIAITQTEQGFPVGRIFCVGRNYAAHAREMGANPEREPPFFFTKAADCVISGTECTLPYPPRTQNLHYEVEVVLGLGSGGRNVSPEQALELVFGAAIGIDFTRRDLQGVAKKAGKPWDMGKSFDGAAVVGEMRRVDADTLPQSGSLALEVNGEQRQRGDISDMIWSMAEIISELSHYGALKAGDLIFTGTPEGVGPVSVGDQLVASAEGLPNLSVSIAPGL